MNLLKLLWDLISPKSSSVMTKERVYERISEDYSLFRKYNLTEGQLYLIYLGLSSDAITGYLDKNRGNIQDYSPPKSDDYIEVLGFVNHNGERHILFVEFEPNYDRKTGNFMKVEDWPSFRNYEKEIEDVHWDVYNEFKGIV